MRSGRLARRSDAHKPKIWRTLHPFFMPAMRIASNHGSTNYPFCEGLDRLDLGVSRPRETGVASLG